MGDSIMPAAKPIYFGPFLVTSQVFYQTKHSFALVNLKPLLPGHTLVCPKRVVPRVKDLSAEEVADLFLAVQKVAKVVEKVYRGESLNIAIQDGAAAGQSVPHVHTHIIPRHTKDLPNTDDIYKLIESDAGDIGKIFREQKEEKEKAVFPQSAPQATSIVLNKELVLDKAGTVVEAIATENLSDGSNNTGGRPKFPTLPPAHLRKPRTIEQMEDEAKVLAKFMEEYN